MKEGFASDAQRKAAFASGYKEKGKKKKEEVEEMMKPQEMMKMNAMKMPIRAMYMKSKKEMKTGDDDMQPMSSMKMNAVTDPKKMNAMTMQDPKQDMAAGYMKSDVRAAVKDGGGDDMSKVKDKQKPLMAMKKESKRYLETKPGSLEEAVLISRGLVEKNLNEAKFKYEMDIDTGARTQLVYGDISANTEAEAQKKYDKLEAEMEKKHRNATIEGGVFDGKNTTTTTGRGTATRKNI